LARKNRSPFCSSLNLRELFGAFRILTSGRDQEFSVDLNDRQQVVQVVRYVTGGFVRFFECGGSGISFAKPLFPSRI
jgi:hypothetical protein